VTPVQVERVRWPDAPLRGFAALGTENLHAPRVLAEPDPLPDAPTRRKPSSSEETTPWDTGPGGSEISTAMVLGSEAGVFDADVYQRILGDELRMLRRRCGWTRKELQRQLPSGISVQTLATYELGSRQCSVVRLVELCLAMDELPQHLIARVHRRVAVDEPGHITVNLRSLATLVEPHLVPLCRWAEDRLRQPGAGEDVQLDLAALYRMAELCELQPAGLVDLLRHLRG
jgi:DNA-binding XRE family transcriptional regulator